MSLLLTLLSIAILSVIYYFYNAFSYWKRKGVPYIQPTFPFGSINMSFAKYSMNIIENMYKKFKSGGAKYGGFYISTIPIFMPVDPEVVKSIMLKNFEHFHDRGIFYDEKIEPLSAHLFALDGTKWKIMRSKLSPTFTSGKIKMMFPNIVACSQNIDKALNELQVKSKALDVRELTARFSTDVIANCAFGLDCQSLLKPEEEFRKYGRMLLDTSLLEKIKMNIGFLAPSVLRFFKISLFKKEVSNYFMSVVKNTVDYREKNNIERKDFLELLIKIKNNENLDDDKIFTKQSSNKVNRTEGDGFTSAEIAAQAFVFYVAGFETSSTTMSYCMFELAQNIDIQEKVREEINQVLQKHDGQLTYEAVMEMHYLDNVISETLRKYPALFTLNRVCTKDFKIENTDIVINKGTGVIIPIMALQKDAEYFPNPEIFDPNRFSQEESAKRVPYTYLPFGDGPRFCIGMRFGLLQTKIGVLSLLRNYKYSVDQKTTLPLHFIANNVLLTTNEKIYLNVQKI